MVIYFLLNCNFTLTGQSEYYSKSVGESGNIGILYDASPLEGGAALVSLYKRDQQIGRSKFGWIEIDAFGHQVDSFYFQENSKLSDQGNTLMLLGDTVLQLAGNTTDRKLLSVHGSSRSRKDSLFRWQYDFSDIAGIDLVTGQSVRINADGNIVIMGTFVTGEPGVSKWVMNVYLVELSRSGELLRRQKVIDIRDHSHAGYVRVTSRIIETEDAYVVAVQREKSSSQFVIVKLDKSGNLIWRQDSDFGHYGGALYTMPDVFLSNDGNRLQVIHCRADDFRDYEDHIADSLYNLYGITEIVIMREYDVETGVQLSHYEKPVYEKGTLIATYGAAKSSVTGEIVFGGEWYAIHTTIPGHIYNGLVGKVSEDGEFTAWRRVMDDFGNRYIRGEEIRGVTELSTGDFLFYGSITNGVEGGSMGWLLKLPLSICFEGAYCEGDTLSLHTIVTSTRERGIGQYSALQLHPNPTSPGQSIHLAGFPNEGYTGEIRLRLLDLQGRVVHETSLNGGHSDAIRWELPASLHTGVYLIEMTTAGGAVAGGKVMVVGE